MSRLFLPLVVLSIVGLAALAPRLLVPRAWSDSIGRPALPPELAWDFSAAHSTDVVSWPAEVDGHLWRVDEPACVTITLPEGKWGRYLVQSLQVRRQGDRVDSIMLGMPCEPAPAARDRAKALVTD